MRLRLDRRRLVAAGAAAALAHASPAPAAITAHARTALGIRGTVEPRRAVGLTFDDGPHPQGTGAVLERLAEGRARATFFLVGEQVVRRPGLVAEIVAAGHEVALHGYTHSCHLTLLPARAKEDVRRGAAALGGTSTSSVFARGSLQGSSTDAAAIQRGGSLTWAFSQIPTKLDPVLTQARTD